MFWGVLLEAFVLRRGHGVYSNTTWPSFEKVVASAHKLRVTTFISSNFPQKLQTLAPTSTAWELDENVIKELTWNNLGETWPFHTHV